MTQKTGCYFGTISRAIFILLVLCMSVNGIVSAQTTSFPSPATTAPVAAPLGITAPPLGSSVAPIVSTPATPQENPKVSGLFSQPTFDPVPAAARPLTLSDFLTHTTDPTARLQAITDYWDCAEKAAISNIAKTHCDIVANTLQRLGSVAPAVTMLAQSEELLAKQRLNDAKWELISSLFRFAQRYPHLQSTGNTQQVIPPLVDLNVGEKQKEAISRILVFPADPPTSATYNTRYEEMAKTRYLSGIAKTLSITIPLQYEAVQSRIEEANRALQALESLQNSIAAAAEQYYRALHQMTDAKLALAKSVIEYNKMIATYVAQTVPGNIRGDSLLMTLNLDRGNRSKTDSSTRGAGSTSGTMMTSAPKQAPSTLISTSTPPPVSPPATFVASSSIAEPTRPAISPSTPAMPAIPILPALGDDQFPATPAPVTPFPSFDTFPSLPPQMPQDKPKPTSDTLPIIRGQMAPVTTPATTPGGMSEEQQYRALGELVQSLFSIKTQTSGAGDTPIIEIPLSLRSAVGQSTSGRERLDVVETYWKLRAKIAQLEIDTATGDSCRHLVETLDQQLAQNSTIRTPEMIALSNSYHSELAGSAARIATIKIEIRYLQIELMQLMKRTTDNGWPIPGSIPYFGPSYRLESDRVGRNTFNLAAETVLIPEKLRSVREIGLAVSSSSQLFLASLTTPNNPNDGYAFLKTLDNHRLIASLFVNEVISLNLSIARYVSDFSEYPIPNDDFVASLLGSTD